MKYVMLIHQGTTPTPRSPEEWARLSEEAEAGRDAPGGPVEEPSTAPRR